MLVTLSALPGPVSYVILHQPAAGMHYLKHSDSIERPAYNWESRRRNQRFTRTD